MPVGLAWDSLKAGLDSGRTLKQRKASAGRATGAHCQTSPQKHAAMTTYTDDTEIDDLVASFLSGNLPKAEWTHAAHFAAALWLLRHRPECAELAVMRGLIRAYNTATGTANASSSGYHETITIASMRTAKSFLETHPPNTPLFCVLDALMAGPPGRSDWLLAYWNRETLFSPDARSRWVDPDKAALPI
ncbi:hypothetical protein [Gluconacetobacter asukensis]|uniref:hypothetical protein n=1 Tax=Gluconacetobacter asukensis TaxID=1017181 RepID=UPI0031E59A50